MSRFQMFLAAIWLVLGGYTAVVIANHGLNLLPVFFGDMAKFAWPGQFNLDFMFMLALSGLWVAWRHQFSIAGLVLGVLAFFGGAMFLSTYLLILTARSSDLRVILVGPARI